MNFLTNAISTLYLCCGKLLTLFNKKKKKKYSDTQTYIASLFLGSVNNTNLADIRCSLPDVDDKDIEDIMTIAEKYAELLVYTNTEKFNENILQILKDYKKKKPDSYKNTMLIDNIIHFWDIFYNIENKKQRIKYNQNQPIIRPTEVFSIKR